LRTVHNSIAITLDSLHGRCALQRTHPILRLTPSYAWPKRVLEPSTETINWQVTPSEGLAMCTHAAQVLTFQGGSRTVPKHLNCVSHLQCLARRRLGWRKVGSDMIKEARAHPLPQESSSDVGCVPQREHLFMHSTYRIPFTQAFLLMPGLM
jgi:hypothetical protein